MKLFKYVLVFVFEYITMLFAIVCVAVLFDLLTHALIAIGIPIDEDYMCQYDLLRIF